MISHQELSDRAEIQDLLVNYIEAIDSRSWDDLDNIFTPDAIIDYTEAGGAKGSLSEIKLYLARALAQFSGFQHMLGLPQIKINGETAKARTICFNPIVMEKDGAPHIFFVGLWYCDTLKRTEQGWRISNRREEVSYFHNLPESFKAASPN